MLSLPDFQIRQRDFLLEITRAITAQLDLSEVLRRVLHASVVMIAGKVGIVALRNDTDGQFYVRAFAGIGREHVPVINAHLADMVSGIKTGIDYEYLNAKLREMAEVVDEELQQSVAMPLVFADKPLGLLIVFRSYQATVTAADVQTLQSFADQAAIAVHNAQMYESINQERKRLAAILQHSGDGVMILDSNLDILQVNQSFEMMTGWRAADAIGANKDDVIVWSRIEQQDLAEAMLNGWPRQKPPIESTETLYVEGQLTRRDGIRVNIGITYAPLYDVSGKLSNIIANLRDITNFKRAQEMQNVFISTVSHELRTPVALIKGYASTMNREDATWDTATLRQSLEVIEDEADRLTELIDDLLTASKIQAEQSVSLQLADVRLDLLAERSVERMQTQASNHDFELSFSEHFPAVHGDARRLRQVIDNLITNAIKYSPNGGRITVGGRYSEQKVTFFVRDEGAGIPASAMPHIFERFYRVDDKLTSQTKGTGLGLYLVKAIIEAHQGTIQVKSQVGQGSTFFFTIPRD